MAAIIVVLIIIIATPVSMVVIKSLYDDIEGKRIAEFERAISDLAKKLAEESRDEVSQLNKK